MKDSKSQYALAFIVGLAMYLPMLTYAWHIAGLIAPMPDVSVWQLWGLVTVLRVTTYPLSGNDVGDDDDRSPLGRTVSAQLGRAFGLAIVHLVVWLVTN